MIRNLKTQDFTIDTGDIDNRYMYMTIIIDNRYMTIWDIDINKFPISERRILKF